MPGSSTTEWAFGHLLRLIVHVLRALGGTDGVDAGRVSMTTDGTIPFRPDGANVWAIIC